MGNNSFKCASTAMWHLQSHNCNRPQNWLFHWMGHCRLSGSVNRCTFHSLNTDGIINMIAMSAMTFSMRTTLSRNERTSQLGAVLIRYKSTFVRIIYILIVEIVHEIGAHQTWQSGYSSLLLPIQQRLMHSPRKTCLSRWRFGFVHHGHHRICR